MIKEADPFESIIAESSSIQSMDVCSSIDIPVCQNVTSVNDSSLNDITNDISDSLNILDQDSCEESRQCKMTILPPLKCLSKSSTFPGPSKIVVLDSGIEKKEAIDGAEHINPKSVAFPCQRSMSMPTDSNLISAMKGSRQKHGIRPLNNLTVKWAPDVYDPIPTAASHVVTTANKNQTRSSKKNNKNKQKRGTKGKDKKKKKQQQACECGSKSTLDIKSLRSLNNDDDAMTVEREGQGGPETDFGDFNVGSSDPHCGSSFLKKSLSKMHFSLAT